LNGPEHGELRLDFALGGEPFRGIGATMVGFTWDEDGYRVMEVRFPLAQDRRRLYAAIARLLLTTIPER